jgi:hypothetical protein
MAKGQDPEGTWVGQPPSLADWYGGLYDVSND